MKKVFKLALLVLLIVGSIVGYQFAIAPEYAIRGSQKNISQVFEGTVGIFGTGHSIVVEPGSSVELLTLAGDGITIRIEEGAHVARIIGAGRNNVVIAPEGAEIDMTGLAGQSNRLQAPAPPTLDGL